MLPPSSAEDILSSLDATHASLAARVKAQTSSPPSAPVLQSTPVSISLVSPQPAAPTGGSTVSEAHSKAAMLIRAAEQQRKLAQLLPDEGMQSEMIAEAQAQEAQAQALLAQVAPAPAAATSGSAWQDVSGGCGDPTPPSTLPPPPVGQSPPSDEPVRAVLRRDSGGLFKLLLKESAQGIFIGRLVASDAAGDERAKLREGDVVTSLNGLRPTSMGFEELKMCVCHPLPAAARHPPSASMASHMPSSNHP